MKSRHVVTIVLLVERDDYLFEGAQSVGIAVFPMGEDVLFSHASEAATACFVEHKA